VHRGVRKQGNVAGTLQREREHALVLRAGAGLATWLDLCAVAHVAAKLGRLFVIDVVDLVDAEGANSSAAEATATTTTAARALATVIATL
jgi:hypothetical protein